MPSSNTRAAATNQNITHALPRTPVRAERWRNSALRALGRQGRRLRRPGPFSATAAVIAVGLAVSVTVGGDRPAPPESQISAYAEDRPKSVIELQRFRETSSVVIETAEGRQGVATLVNLNPAVSAWFLLRLEWVGGGDPEVYHLELVDHTFDRLSLGDHYPSGVLLTRGGTTNGCDLWSGKSVDNLADARASRGVFAPLCDGRVYLRNPVVGHRTSKEWAADFLRDHVWQGERLTTIVRDTFFKDRQRRTASTSFRPKSSSQRVGPASPLLADTDAEHALEPRDLGLVIEREADGRVVAGAWYPAQCCPGIHVSTIVPRLVATIAADTGAAGSPADVLDRVEADSLVYLVAFDLKRFDLGFALGTDHPRVGWSERVPNEVRDDRMPGPDGIGTVSPLVRTGMLSPERGNRVAVTFTGGFKRSHGAFKWSELAQRNHGSHYGFVEEGVVLSKLQPGLSTLTVLDDGTVGMGTWRAENDGWLGRIRFARQNGVPIVEHDEATGISRPGDKLTQWGPGNWSGSQDQKLRTLRAGICMQDAADGPGFLLYGYFSSATPSAMARVFLAYRCRYAMLLDMNALEHTYLALYRPGEAGLMVEHLIAEMQVVDKEVEGKRIPRFVAFADNRDFFYLLRRTSDE